MSHTTALARHPARHIISHFGRHVAGAEGSGEEPDAPPTLDLTATPTSVVSGASSTLSWTSTNATTLVASGDWSGSKAVPSGNQVISNITANKNYLLTATGDGGIRDDTATVTVLAIPTVVLDAAPTALAAGASATLTWVSTDAATVVASGDWSGSKALSGSELITNITATSNYILTATAPGGEDIDDADVTVVAAPTVTIDADPTSVVFGEDTTLTWSSTDALTCIASGDWSGSKALSGSELIESLTASKIYTLTVEGIGGSGNDLVEVSVIPGAIELDAETPVIFDISDALGVDLQLRSADALIQFGDDTLTALTFDPLSAIYYPRNFDPDDVVNLPGFGVEPIGPPVGATTMAVLSVQPGGVLDTASVPLPSYGGEQYELWWEDTDVSVWALQLSRAFSAATYPISLVAACKADTELVGSNADFVGLYPAAVGDNNPHFAIRKTSGNVWRGHVTNNAPTITVQTGTSGVSALSDRWEFLALTIDAGNTELKLWKYNSTSGLTSQVDSDADHINVISIDATLSHLLIGGSSLGTNPVAGSMMGIMVTDHLLTQEEVERMAENPSPRMWPLCLDDENVDNVRAYCPIRAAAPLMDWVSGRQFVWQNTAAATDSAANMAQRAVTGPPPWTVRMPNRLTNDVNFIGYSNVASGDVTPTLAPALGRRAHVHHDLRYDVGLNPNPATQFAVAPAGVSILGDIGGANGEIDIINDSGSAADTGQLNLCALDYHPADYFEDTLVDPLNTLNQEIAPVLSPDGRLFVSFLELVGTEARNWIAEIDQDTGLPVGGDPRHVDCGRTDVNYRGTAHAGYYGDEGDPVLYFAFLGRADDSNALSESFIRIVRPSGALGATSQHHIVGFDDVPGTVRNGDELFDNFDAGDLTERVKRVFAWPMRSLDDPCPRVAYYVRSVADVEQRIEMFSEDFAANRIIVVDQSNYNAAPGTYVESTSGFTTQNGSHTVTVRHDGHNVGNREYVTFSGGVAVGGLNMTGTWKITRIDADHFSFQHPDTAVITLGNPQGNANYAYGAPSRARPAQDTVFLKEAGGAFPNTGDGQWFSLGRFHSPALGAGAKTSVFDYSGLDWENDTDDTNLIETNVSTDPVFSHIDTNHFPVGAENYYVAGTSTGEVLKVYASTGGFDGSYAEFASLDEIPAITALYVRGALEQSFEPFAFNDGASVNDWYVVWWCGDNSDGGTFTAQMPGELWVTRVSDMGSARISQHALTENDDCVIEGEPFVANGIAYVYWNHQEAPVDADESAPWHMLTLGTQAQLDAKIDLAMAEAAAI